MTSFIQYALLGLGGGAVYALLGSGIVLIYRGSGTVNFAHGVFAMVGAYVFAELQSRGVSAGPALGAAIVAGAGLGFLMQNPIMRALQSATPLARTVATIGVLISLQAVADLRYGSTTMLAAQFLPQHTWTVGAVTIQASSVVLLAIAAAVALSLAAAKRWSLLGLATSAAAESARGVATLGWSPNLLATVNWTLGGALAGAAGALIAPLTGLQVSNLVLLVIPALAAGLLGRFSSFVGTFLGAVLIGVVQSLSVKYVTVTGFEDTVPFFVIIVTLVFTGTSLPLRSHIAEALPSIGSGRVRKAPLVVAVGVTAALMLFLFSDGTQGAFTASLSVAILLLSLVVLTGYAGQISLGQYALAGMGAYIAGRLVATQGWPFWTAALAGICAAVPIGVAFALPALRTRGVNLAVVTLGLGFGLQRMVFDNVSLSGGENGTNVGFIKLFGYNINAIVYPRRYDLFVLALFLIAALGVANLRRSPAGRRLIAIRSNERAAASLGVSVVGAKLYAFGVASGIAALAGIAIAFQSPSIVYDNFSPLQSIYAVGLAVLGGVGYVLGPLLASPFAGGGIGSLLDPLLHGIDNYLTLIGGVAMLLILFADPDGLVALQLATFRAQLKSKWAYIRPEVLVALAVRKVAGGLRGRLSRPTWMRSRARGLRLAPPMRPEKVRPQTLEVVNLTVRHGGVVALSEVSLQVRPGEIVGLIGPNGAGKTTLIDAITGFTRPASGVITLGDSNVTELSPHARVGAGLVRSWQSLELFDSATVFENIQVASDTWHWTTAIRAFFYPGKARLNAAASAAVRAFELEGDLDERVTELSFSQRRFVATARAIALNPSVLLLDEPAAGMSDVRRAELAKVIRRVAGEWGMGLLVVDHDMPFVMDLCDRIVALSNGRKIADGAPEEVRADPMLRAAYLRTGSEARADEDGSQEKTEGEDESFAQPGGRRAEGEDVRTRKVLLEARELAVGYHEHPVVRALGFEVHAGEIVALLGANRAGKTTTLMSLAGEIRPLQGDVYWLGSRVGKRVPLHRRAAQGLGFVTDERSVFSQLTVAENLRLGRCDPERTLSLFPELRPLQHRRAGLLSGGEQQMLGLGRALARNPRVLLVDELSVGLAPQVVSRLMDALRQAADEQGMAVVLVEQHVQEALRISDRVCVIAGGRMILHGLVDEVGHRVEDAFLADVLGVYEATAG